MSANFVLCNRHVLCRHHAYLIDVVVPVSYLTGKCHLRSAARDGLFDVPRSRMAFGSLISWPFFVQILSKIVNFVFVQNAKFRNFIRFWSKKRISCVPTNYFLISGFSSGPPSAVTIRTGFTCPLSSFVIASNSGRFGILSKSAACDRAVDKECFPDLMAM